MYDLFVRLVSYHQLFTFRQAYFFPSELWLNAKSCGAIKNS